MQQFCSSFCGLRAFISTSHVSFLFETVMSQKVVHNIKQQLQAHESIKTTARPEPTHNMHIYTAPYGQWSHSLHWPGCVLIQNEILPLYGSLQNAGPPDNSKNTETVTKKRAERRLPWRHTKICCQEARQEETALKTHEAVQSRSAPGGDYPDHTTTIEVKKRSGRRLP